MVSPNARGSIALHQTTLIPAGGVTPLFLLTVPKNEVADMDVGVADVARALLPGSQPGMTTTQFDDISSRVSNSFIWTELMDFPFRFGPFPPSRRWELELERLRGLSFARSVDLPAGQVLLQGLLSPVHRPYVRGTALLRQYGRRSPIPYFPLPLDALHWSISLNKRELGLTQQQVDIFIQMASVLSEDKPASVFDAFDDLSEFDIPFSLSKPSDKRSLSDLVHEARIVAFIPMVPGAVEASSLISEGQYVIAAEVAAVSGGITLLLVATYALAERILESFPRGPRRRR